VRAGRRTAGPATILAAAAAIAAAARAPAAAQPATLVIRGGTVLPVAGPPIENGTIVVRDGRIAAVGRDLPVPAGATVVDATGKYVTPGLIDAMTHYGLDQADLNETTTALTPELRAIEAHYPFGSFGSGPPGPPVAKDLLLGGVTTQYVATADRTIVGGQGAIVKTAADTFDGLIVREPAGLDITLGSQPTRVFREANRSPMTRIAVVSQLREALVRAQEYDARVRAHAALPEAERRTRTPPARDLGMEAYGRMLRREMPARIQANRSTEIRVALDLAREFGFDLILESGAAAHTMAAELAARRVPVVLGPVSHPFVSGEEIPDRSEYPDADPRSAARLRAAGANVAIATFSRSFGALGRGTGKWLLLDAMVAAGYGLSDGDVLRAVTLGPAEILGIADRVGSLEVGKGADIVIFDGPPLSVRTWVERVFVGGREVYVRGEG
jgi:imidazolonepropionase-like amidohydrolase